MFPEPMRCCAMAQLEVAPGEAAGGAPSGAALIRAARRLLGVRFRPQGRGLEGVDCVGLVLLAAKSVGMTLQADSYPLRGPTLLLARRWLADAGCREVALRAVSAGDLVLSAPAVRQVHLAFWTGRGVIEAHAGLGRVVERPGPMDAQWDSAWRLPVEEA